MQRITSKLPGTRLCIGEKGEKKLVWAKKKNCQQTEPKGSQGREKGFPLPRPIFFLLDPVVSLFAPLWSLVPGYFQVALLASVSKRGYVQNH